MIKKNQRKSGYRGNKGGSNTTNPYVCKCGQFVTFNWSAWIRHRMTCPGRPR